MSIDLTKFLERLAAAQSDAEREWLAMEMSLNALSPTLQAAVWAAAIPHWFDEPFLFALLTEAERQTLAAEDGFNKLTALSFVEIFPERGYNVHERTRELLRERLWRTEQRRYQELSRRAAAYCAGQDQEESGWRVEKIYHRLLADEPLAVYEFSEQGIAWHNSFQYDKVELLTRPILAAVAAGRIQNGDTIAWAYFWQGSLDIGYSRNRQAKKNLEQALMQKTSGRSVQANCIRALGDVHMSLSEYGAARERYEEARPIYQQIGARLGEANCIQALGDLHGELELVEEGIRYLHEAADRFQELELPHEVANCWNSIGNLFSQQERHHEAVEAYNQAINKADNAMWRRNRAGSQIELGNFEAALRDLDAAEKMQPDQPYVWLHRGRIALQQNQPADAVALLQKAVAERPQLNEFHFWLSYALLLSGRPDEAFASLEQAIAATYKARDIAEAVDEVTRLETIYGSSPGIEQIRARLMAAKETTNPL
jgi:tetratricopeptide (TPR) repeat protein